MDILRYEAAMRIGVAGISGRMGRLVAEEVNAAGATLTGGVTRSGVGDLALASDALIDFTHPETAVPHAAAAAKAGCVWILGTTGLDAAAEVAVREAARRIAIVWAANFSPGITLLLDLAQRLAAALPASDYDAEILEMHHRYKRDAPSGTALALGQAVAAGRGVDLAAVRADARGGTRPLGAIGFASLRGGQVVGEHTLLFAGVSEQISIHHSALDRRIFASGAVRAALWAKGRPPGLYSMNDVLNLNPGTKGGTAA